MLALSLVAVVCPGVAAEREEAARRVDDGGVYRRPLGNEPATLDPARIGDIYSRSVSQQIFDGLVQFDQTLAVRPALAQFWKSTRDGLVWTFTLRRGVHFHHGRELTSDDVLFSLTRLLDPRVRSGAADLLMHVQGARQFREGRAPTVAGFSAPDRYTVQVRLSEAQVPFVSILAVGHFKIVPRDLVEGMGEAFGTQPVGTGPFRFVRWERGREIVLAANRDYFDGAPRLARVVFRIFPGEPFEQMYEEFRRGALEDSPIPSTAYRRILAEGGHVYVKRPTMSVRFYGMNLRVKPLDDRRVRQALAHAIDRQAIVDELAQGRFALARGVLPPGMLGYNPKLKGIVHAPERARELLAEAGHPGGRGLPPITVWSSVRAEGVLREHEYMRRDAAAVGLQLEFRYLTNWPAFSKQLAEGRMPMFLYAWFGDVPDPDNFLFRLFHSRSPRNFFGLASPLVDEMLVQARTTGDLERRVELYRRAEQLVLDEVPLVPIFHYTYERLFQPYVRSIEVNGLGDPYIPLRRVWLDRGGRGPS